MLINMRDTPGAVYRISDMQKEKGPRLSVCSDLLNGRIYLLAQASKIERIAAPQQERLAVAVAVAVAVLL
jgi:hypothetical protein